MVSDVNKEYFEIQRVLNHLSIKYTEIARQNDALLEKFENNSKQIVSELENVNKLEKAFLSRSGFDKLKELDKLKTEYNLNEEYVVNEVLNIQSINKNLSKLFYNKSYKRVEPIFKKLILGLAFIKDNKENLKNIDLENLTFQFKKSLLKLLMFTNKEVLSAKFTIMENRFKVDNEEEELIVNENLIAFIASDIAPFFKMTSVVTTYFNESQFFNKDVSNMNKDLFVRYFKNRYAYGYEKIGNFLTNLEKEDSSADKQLLITNFTNELNSFILQEYHIYENLLNYEYSEDLESTVLDNANMSKLKRKSIVLNNSEIKEKIDFNTRFVNYLQNILNDLQFLKKFNSLINTLSLPDVIMGIYSYSRYFEYEDKEDVLLIAGKNSDLLEQASFKGLVRPLLENFQVRLFKLIKGEMNSIETVSKESLLSVFDILIKIYDILPLPIFTTLLNYILSELLKKKVVEKPIEEDIEIDNEQEYALSNHIFFILVIQNFIKNFELDIEALNSRVPFDSISMSTVTTSSRSTEARKSNSIEILSSMFTDLVSNLIALEIKLLFKGKLEIHSNEDYMKLNEFILIDLKSVYSKKYRNLEQRLFQLNSYIDSGINEPEPENDTVTSDFNISLAVPNDDIIEFLSTYKSKLDFKILSSYSQLSKINSDELVSLDSIKEAIEL